MTQLAKATEIQKRWSTDQLITGITLGEWFKMLAANRFHVSPTYFHRVAWISGWGALSSVLGAWESLRWGRKVREYEPPDPIFLLGHWRSGTTHLHNLLGRVPGHTYSTVYQAIFPNAFLSTDPFIPNLTSGLMDETRTYDNVKNGWHEEAEDEIALAKMTGLSPYITFMFPDQAEKYEKYVDFHDATPEERERWKAAFKKLVAKISLQNNGDRVVIKSCTHTARIKLLLEMYPNARFVNIHRHPIRVFASTLHMRSHTDWENFFQVPEANWEDRRVDETLRLGQRVFERVVEERDLIPPGNYYELAYDDLVGNELAVVKDIWDKLDLGDWQRAEPSVKQYIASLGEYKVNDLPALDPVIRAKVVAQWKVAFEAFGYSPDAPERIVKPPLGQPIRP